MAESGLADDLLMLSFNDLILLTSLQVFVLEEQLHLFSSALFFQFTLILRTTLLYFILLHLMIIFLISFCLDGK